MFGGLGETARERAQRKLRRLAEGGEVGMASALNAAREAAGLTQHGLGRETETDQGLISRIEAGKAKLLPEVAERLAPALGVDADRLVLLEGVRLMGKMAAEGRLDPHTPASLAMRLLETRPSSPEVARFGDELLEELIELAEMAAETHGGAGGKGPKAATKAAGSAKRRGRRDGRGRRLGDPFGVKGGRGEAGEDDRDQGPRRDSRGRRLVKPYAPRRGGL